MSKIADQEYLRTDQYQNAAKFNARVELHKRFSTNPYGWLRWVMDQLQHELAPTCRVLEIGCGPGYLWAENIERIPRGWEITLSDFSAGMLHEAQRNLAQSTQRFTFEAADAQSLPFPAAGFDAVIANHMLYHVPDREQAYAEIKRVLRPRGHFFAATNGSEHLKELNELAALLDSRLARWAGLPANTFLLENGGQEIARWFQHVELRRYKDGLIVDEAEPLAAFMLSMADSKVLSPEEQQALVSRIAQHLAEHGAQHIRKEAGIFVAVRDAVDK